MTKSKREEAGQIVIRPPAGMRDRIKAAAEANNRSMNAEIVATLEEKYPGPASPAARKWFELEDQIQAKKLKLDELWELSRAKKGTPEFEGITDEYLRISREVDELRMQQARLINVDTAEIIEKYFQERGLLSDFPDGYGGDGSGYGYGDGEGDGYGDGDGAGVGAGEGDADGNGKG